MEPNEQVLWSVDIKTQCYLHCCYRKSRAACAQSFALWQQATIEFTCHDHSSRTLVVTFNCSQVNIGRASTPRSLYYCLFAPHICIWCCSSRTFRSWWTAYSAQRQLRGCNNSMWPLLWSNLNKSGWCGSVSQVFTKPMVERCAMLVLPIHFRFRISKPRQSNLNKTSVNYETDKDFDWSI